ncbi:MAG: hypothetical protein A2068_10905 [Ignavibacteria bacterium GWB2_35_6b]|nr:MAG: hypothetical protein A2068_10905 [Ignavibacteria bacterium GWB2_35_6b]
MAEIKIEKKKPIWIWMLLGLGLVAVFIYFMSLNDDYDDMKEVPETTDFINVKENNPTVSAFVNFIESDTNHMSMDHAFTHDAIIKLANATIAIADEVDYEIKSDMDMVKEYAVTITEDSLNTTHADDISRAADILSNVLQNIQLAKYPGLTNEVTELRNAANSINPDVLTLDQKVEVKSYFRSAAGLLKKMN